MSVASPSRRLLAATVVQIVLFAIAFTLIGSRFWSEGSFSLRVVAAFLLMGIALAVGWFGAAWSRQARPEVPYSEELEDLRRQLMRRSRVGFAVVIGVAGGVVGALAPRFESSPRWGAALVGVAVGALVGLFLGQLGGSQVWMSRIPKMRPAGAPNKSLERTRER
jgi:hypothetical protein